MVLCMHARQVGGNCSFVIILPIFVIMLRGRHSGCLCWGFSKPEKIDIWLYSCYPWILGWGCHGFVDKEGLQVTLLWALCGGMLVQARCLDAWDQVEVLTSGAAGWRLELQLLDICCHCIDVRLCSQTFWLLLLQAWCCQSDKRQWAHDLIVTSEEITMTICCRFRGF